MSPETARPAAGNSRPGLGDFRERRKIEVLSTENPHQAQALRRIRRQRQVEQICRLGPRVVFELLDEIKQHHGIDDDIDWRLERYAGLDPDVLAVLGGDRFAVSPLRVIGGDR